jgi:hypothetical protein
MKVLKLLKGVLDGPSPVPLSPMGDIVARVEFGDGRRIRGWKENLGMEGSGLREVSNPSEVSLMPRTGPVL